MTMLSDKRCRLRSHSAEDELGPGGHDTVRDFRNSTDAVHHHQPRLDHGHVVPFHLQVHLLRTLLRLLRRPQALACHASDHEGDDRPRGGGRRPGRIAAGARRATPVAARSKSAQDSARRRRRRGFA